MEGGKLLVAGNFYVDFAWQHIGHDVWLYELEDATAGAKTYDNTNRVEEQRLIMVESNARGKANSS